jgi:hypothetical protein
MKMSDITIVFQGVFKPYVTRDGEAFARNIAFTRKVLPGARVILSTWEGADVGPRLKVDKVVLSEDPGPLAPLKLSDTKPNNCNRQLRTTQAGMAAVETPYAIKMRTDCWLEHAGFLDFAAEQQKRDGGRERLLACSFFTLDPTMFERLPYHISDWFHFGRTETLRQYWSAPPLAPEQARHYETLAHTPDATLFERRFRAAFAVEQHLCLPFAAARGYGCPRFLNDATPAVLSEHARFVANETMLLDPWQIGLVFDKYRWAGGSSFQRMNNLMHLDWLALQEKPLAMQEDAAGLRLILAERARQKAAMRAAFRRSRPLHALLFDPGTKGRHVRSAARFVKRFL